MSRFPMTYCSQCGAELGPGNEGVSHCDEHADPRRMGLEEAQEAGHFDADPLTNAYAEGRKDEREDCALLCDEAVAEMRSKGSSGTALAGVEALADTLRGIDSATGKPADLPRINVCGRCGGAGECAQQADNHAPGSMYLDNCPDCKGTGLNCQRAHSLLSEAVEILATYMRWIAAHPGKSAPADLLTRMANVLSEVA